MRRPYVTLQYMTIPNVARPWKTTRDDTWGYKIIPSDTKWHWRTPIKAFLFIQSPSTRQKPVLPHIYCSYISPAREDFAHPLDYWSVLQLRLFPFAINSKRCLAVIRTLNIGCNTLTRQLGQKRFRTEWEPETCSCFAPLRTKAVMFPPSFSLFRSCRGLSESCSSTRWSNVVLWCSDFSLSFAVFLYVSSKVHHCTPARSCFSAPYFPPQKTP